MKKAILLITTLILAVTGYAQQFAPKGTTWYYTEGWAFSGNIGYIFLEAAVDTMVLGKNCRRIDQNKTVACRPQFPVYMYDEDSVVYYSMDSVSGFQTLYDLKAGQGASWTSAYTTDQHGTDTVKITVDSTGMRSVNSTMVKVLYVQYQAIENGLPGATHHGEILGFIGDLDFLMNFYPIGAICDLNYAGPLRCFDNGSISYQYDTTACTYTTTGLREYARTSVSVYPNPVSTVLNFRGSSDQVLHFEMFDLNGRLQREERLGTDRRVDVTDLPNGIYMVRLSNESQEVLFNRLIQVDRR